MATKDLVRLMYPQVCMLKIMKEMERPNWIIDGEILEAYNMAPQRLNSLLESDNYELIAQCLADSMLRDVDMGHLSGMMQSIMKREWKRGARLYLERSSRKGPGKCVTFRDI